MDCFHNKDDAYRGWLESHPTGFVINAHTSGPRKSIIHSARCRWLYPIKPAKSLTGQYPKICSMDRAVLEQWARREGHALKDCAKCDN